MPSSTSSSEPVQRSASRPWRDRTAVVLLGALVMAILALQKSPRTEDFERDTSGEEVPLFI